MQGAPASNAIPSNPSASGVYATSPAFCESSGAPPSASQTSARQECEHMLGWTVFCVWADGCCAGGDAQVGRCRTEAHGDLAIDDGGHLLERGHRLAQSHPPPSGPALPSWIARRVHGEGENARRVCGASATCSGVAMPWCSQFAMCCDEIRSLRRDGPSVSPAHRVGCSRQAMCSGRSGRGPVLHERHVVDVGHFRAADALVDPANHCPRPRTCH
jgi:hypothetical protein